VLTKENVVSTACRLKVSDFHQDGDEATLRLHEKGDKRRIIGLHFTAAQAISEYLAKAGLTSGPLFRPRLGPRSQKLAARPLEASALYLLLQHYLEQLPGATKEEQLSDGSTIRRCIYTPHSLRATTATLLLDANVDIVKVKDLLGHRHITTTQIYDKRRRSTWVAESASHLLAI
jgi:integrase